MKAFQQCDEASQTYREGWRQNMKGDDPSELNAR
jgi:hypothetical protein